MNGTLSDYWKHGAIVAAAIIGFLFAVTTTLAATVNKVGDTATGITGLTVGSQTYDVDFERTEASTLYPLDQFDFDTARNAALAAEAVVAALNDEGGVLSVGECTEDPCEIRATEFFIPYAATTETFDPYGPIGPDPIDIPSLEMERGVTGDPNRPGVWASDPSEGFARTERSYAKFTLTGEGGSGNLPPTAEAGGPYNGLTGNPVSFDGSDSSDFEGSIDTYTWNFGDGNSGSGVTTTHTYATADRYNVTLTVTDSKGTPDSDTTLADIGEITRRPHAEAGGPYSGSAGSTIRFDGSESYDPDGKIATWDWEFGDGNVSSGPTPNHVYDGAGLYQVTLTVTDDSGETDMDFSQATIGVGGLPPTADAGGPYFGAAGVAKQFDGSDSSDLDGIIETYTWDFGDNSPTGDGRTPSHIYGAAGSYTVRLTVTDDSGLSNSSATTAIIGDGQPNADDRLVDLATLPDVGGSADRDIAVLNVALVNGDQLSATIHVHDGGTGEEILQTTLTQDWRSIALKRVPGNTEPLLAVLQVESGDMRVQLLNANDGSVHSNIPYFENEDWTPIDILGVRDAGGLGVSGIGVLAENPAGQQAIEVHTVVDGAFVNQVLYFNDVWAPLARSRAAIDLGEFNGNGYSEMSVLATNNAGKHAVETRDLLSGKQISRYFYFGPTNTMIGIADVADVDGNSRPENVVLGSKDASDKTANSIQAKDVKTGVLVAKIGTYGPEWTSLGIRSIGDVDGNGDEEVVVAVLKNDLESQGGISYETRVSVRDIAGNSLTRQMLFLGPAYELQDVEVLGDVSGNSIEEVVVAGLDRTNTGQFLAIRVQVNDALEGTALLVIDLN
jgi:PKD repeat protein